MADWSELEVDLIVDDYFQMLQEEIKGGKPNKTTHRNRLLSLLNNRTPGSVERKHQNISAVLIKNGYPYINGYKPLNQYQRLLEIKVLQYVSNRQSVELTFDSFASQIVTPQMSVVNYDKWLTEPPKTTIVEEPVANYYVPKKRNYLELEQKNRSIGFVGEELAFEYEKWRLAQLGEAKLAKEVKWISRDQGDGAGYDILSKKVNGEDLYIEVKTTTLGKDTPIFFSKTENDFSNDYKESFQLYRIFDVKKDPKMFTRNGRFQDICTIEPTNFKGVF